jgi:thiamine pyrophosphate-dependent acetolactate synthase large subunit-like protein
MLASDNMFHCNTQKLQTVARNQLPAKMVVINNRCHGMRLRSAQFVFQNRRRVKLAPIPTFAGWPKWRQPTLWNTRESELCN